MSTGVVPTVEEIKTAISDAVPGLSVQDQQIAVASYRVLSRGEPASPDAIAAEAGVPVEVVQDRLGEWAAVFRNDDGAVVGFWGLAIVEMPHRLELADGTRLYAWCAWDPLFLAPIIGDLAVATTDATTGADISYRVVDGAVVEASHPDGVLSFLRPDEPWDDTVMSTFCHYVLHFETQASAEAWIGQHPGTFALALPDAVAVAHHHVQRTFSDALRDDG